MCSETIFLLSPQILLGNHQMGKVDDFQSSTAIASFAISRTNMLKNCLSEACHNLPLKFISWLHGSGLSQLFGLH